MDKKFFESKKVRIALVGVVADFVAVLLVKSIGLDPATAAALIAGITLKVFGHNTAQGKQDVAILQSQVEPASKSS